MCAGRAHEGSRRRASSGQGPQFPWGLRTTSCRTSPKTGTGASLALAGATLGRDPRFTQDPTRLPEEVRQRFFGHKLRSLSRHLLTVDPPDHTRMRSLVSKAFTPRRIEELRPRITAICSELLEGLMAQGSGGGLPQSARPISQRFIDALVRGAESAGLPAGYIERLRRGE